MPATCSCGHFFRALFCIPIFLTKSVGADVVVRRVRIADFLSGLKRKSICSERWYLTAAGKLGTLYASCRIMDLLLGAPFENFSSRSLLFSATCISHSPVCTKREQISVRVRVRRSHPYRIVLWQIPLMSWLLAEALPGFLLPGGWSSIPPCRFV